MLPSRRSLLLSPAKCTHHCSLILPKFFSQISPLPNPDSLVSALVTAVTSCTSITHCRVIHSRVIKSLNYRDGFIGDQLTSRYAILGYREDAQSLFDEMPDKDLVSWNSLISSFSRSGWLHMCLKAFYTMKFEILMKPNEITIISIISACTDIGANDGGEYVHGFALKSGLLLQAKVANSLINMYGKCGYLDAAYRLFESMPVENIISWNSIIAALLNNGFSNEAMDSFNKMRREGIKPDDVTMMALLQACEDLGIRKSAEAIHALIFQYGLNKNIAISTSLLNSYAKLGMLNASQEVFQEMINPDRVTWTAMLAGYAMHGFGREAIKVFESMVNEGFEPDHVSFTHLLSACSHSGLVDEGKKYFKLMHEVYKVEPRLDHYSCMVDLLGRSGLLFDAYELINSMPIEPNSGVWGALLNACRVHKNVELGTDVAERLLRLDPLDSQNYIMLSNIYSEARLWKNASKVRGLMKERGLIRIPGCSFFEHGNKIHRFVVGDRSHPESEKIHDKLKEVIAKVREVGCVSRTEFVLHDVDEEVKEDMVNKHSEKLAIAFGLLVTDAGMPLVITKNLRICGDCHSTAKAISLIEKRIIIIRDSKRFHHFSNGLCSCGDYW